MLKNVVKIEFTIAEKLYQFICDHDSPIENIKEALFQCQKYIGSVEDQIKARQQVQQSQQPQETPKSQEEVKEESKSAE